MTPLSPDVNVWRASSGTGIGFWIHVTPRAQHPGVGGVRGDALRVAVSAPPVEGEANEACARALAGAFGVARRTIGLDPAARGRRKRVTIAGDPDALERRARALAASAAGTTGG